MKYLKKFENFDYGNDQDTDTDEQDYLNNKRKLHEIENGTSDEDDEECDEDDEECHTDENPTMEKKKIPAGLQKYLDKKNKGKSSKKDEKEDETPKGKGLTAKQKKLPEGLRKAIEARAAKKK